MLQSGQKSYHDDYIRKRGSSRIIHDPPSLLTDRGAYVNFLEVQLERVSAACLGVQSYDQRIYDMQSLIVHLEERIAGTTRLLALSQQCGEVINTVFASKYSIDLHISYHEPSSFRNSKPKRINASNQYLDKCDRSIKKC